MTRAEGSHAKPWPSGQGKREADRHEPEGNAASGNALRGPEIATVERRRRALLARGRSASSGAPRAGHSAQTGCARGTRAPAGAPPPPRGGNDATRPAQWGGGWEREAGMEM